MVLNALVEKSLIRRDFTGRYDIHELLRQFAAGELDASARESQAARLKEREQDIYGARQVEALNEIMGEMENVRAAWRWAIEKKDASSEDAGGGGKPAKPTCVKLR